MIHIFVGTKAQFIKMMPIMLRLRERGVNYNLIDAGQHAGLTTELLDQFGLRYPDVFLRRANTNINTITQAISWAVCNFGRSIFCKKQIYQKIFQSQNGVCLIHGDTLTTLISLLFAKRCDIIRGGAKDSLSWLPIDAGSQAAVVVVISPRSRNDSFLRGFGDNSLACGDTIT